MAMGEVDGSTYACFCHEHFSYVFSFRPCRLSEVVQEGVCPNEITLNNTTFSNSTFTRVCMGKECTFVCVHPHSTPAHSAVVNTEIRYVSTLGDVTASSIFDTKDFEWPSSGLIAVPFSSLMCVVNDPGAVKSMTRQMMVTLKGESSKTEIIKQVIKLRLGDEFTVTHKPVVERKGQSFSPYSKSRHDLCIQHKVNNFKCSGFKTSSSGTSSGTVVAGVFSSSILSVTESRRNDGDLITSVIEVKSNEYSRDQLLAEMLCTITDCSVDLLQRGKQINEATIYGVALNYATVMCKVSRMTINFERNDMKWGYVKR